MARDGSGNYSRIHNWVTDLGNSIPVTASRHDAEDDSIATALTNSLDRSAGGGGDILRDVGMSNHKFTALATGSALTDSINLDDVQSGKILFFGTTGGTSTVYTLAPSPSINAYDTGMAFYFKVDQDCGATPTLNISAKGARNLVWQNQVDGASVSIQAGDLQTDKFYRGIITATEIAVENVSVASTTTKGVVELATSAEAEAITDTERALTPNSITNIANKVLIETQVASNTGTIAFLTGIDSTYKNYLVEFTNVRPITDDVEFRMLITEDGGSTYKSGASDYGFSNGGYSSAGALSYLDNANSFFSLSDNSVGVKLGNVSNESYNGEIIIYNPSLSGFNKIIKGQVAYDSAGATSDVVNMTIGGKYYGTQNAINGWRFFMSSGNISVGTFKLYGLR
jgi:hypothetical protein